VNSDDVAYIWLFLFKKIFLMLNFTFIVYSLLHIMSNKMASDFLMITTLSYLVEVSCVFY